MKTPCFLTGTLLASVLAGCAGPSADERSTVRMDAPRVNVDSYMTPEVLKKSIVADGCTVTEASGLDEGARRLIEVRGTGVVYWPSATVKVEKNRIILNGVVVESQPDGYRNVTVGKDGRVYPDTRIPWERHWPLP